MAGRSSAFLGAWSWLVEGTLEAVVGGIDRWRSRAALQVTLEAHGGVVATPGGTVLARLVEAEGALRIEPPAAAARLAGAAVEVRCPAAWLFRRKLDSVAAKGAPFLEAFVRHQVDRLTPWRADDVDLSILHAPLPGDPARLSVEVGVIPKRLTAAALAALRACDPARLSLVAVAASDGCRFAMRLDDGSAARLRRLRPRVAVGLAVFLLAWPAAIGWLWWSTAMVSDEIAAADQVIAERRGVLAAAARRAEAAGGEGGALLQLRQGRSRAVDLIDALSAALPDTAYATELTLNGSELRLSGVTTDAAALVPALEGSGWFTGATFYDTTTRLEGDGRGDRFHLLVQARPPAATTPAP